MNTYNIVIYIFLSIFASILINILIRFYLNITSSREEKYRLKKIEALSKILMKSKYCIGFKVSKEDITRLLLDYSMNTQNISSAKRNLNRIENKFYGDEEIKSLLHRSKQIIDERLQKKHDFLDYTNH